METRIDEQHASDSREIRRQMSRFLLVGGVSTATDFLVYLLLGGPLGLLTNLAKAISYLTGMAVGYLGNKHWTFGSPRRSLAEPAFYVALYVTTLFVNVALNALVLTFFGEGLTIVAFLVATGTTMVLNFVGLRMVTFRVGIHERRTAPANRPSLARSNKPCCTLPIVSIPPAN